MIRTFTKGLAIAVAGLTLALPSARASNVLDLTTTGASRTGTASRGQ